MKRILTLMMILIVMMQFMAPKAFGETITVPTISSDTAILIDSKTGTVLYEKNADQPMYPASLTKIATAIYAIENGNLEDIVTVSENADALNVEGTTVFLKEGEQVPLKKLIQGLLINSGNDAGIAIAEHLSGSIEQFAKNLNEYLKTKIGVKNTHFVNPHGLFDYEHVTTAADLATITQYALQNELFREIFGTVSLDWNGEAWDTTLISHHKMLKGEIRYEEVTGGKTGYVDQSGHTLATSAEGDRISLIVITMKSNTQQEAYADTAKLLDYGFANFVTESLVGDSVIEWNNQGYMVPKDTYYTKPKNYEVVQKISPNGNLEISDENGIVTNTISLEKIKEVTEGKTINITKENTSGLSVIWIVSLILFVLVFILFSIRFVRRRKRYKQEQPKSYYQYRSY